MKKILIFLIFSVLTFQVFSFDKEAAKKEAKEWWGLFSDAAVKVTEQKQKEQRELEEKYNPVVVNAKKATFKYTGSDKNEILMAGIYAYDFHGSDEYYIPTAISFKNKDGYDTFGLAIMDGVFEKKRVNLAFSNNGIWYVGQLYINTNVNNRPSMEVLEVRNKNEAITILTEMFSVYAYMAVNYSDLGFRNVARIEENITFRDTNNVDWKSNYTFETVVPSDIVHSWGYDYCNVMVYVTKYNKLNGALYSPYDYYISHPLMFCDAMECTACGLYPCVVAQFGAHKAESMSYNENYFNPIPIVDTQSKWKLEIIKK